MSRGADLGSGNLCAVYIDVLSRIHVEGKSHLSRCSEGNRRLGLHFKSTGEIFAAETVYMIVIVLCGVSRYAEDGVARRAAFAVKT